MTRTLRTETADGVRSIVLCRAAEYNTITPALRDELAAAIDEADVDRDVHVILLRADGPAFCTGDEIPARTAADIGLVLEVVPDDALQAHAFGLAQRMARVPVSQLVMLKLLVNQTAENMGLTASRTLGTLFDGIARHTQEGLDFVRRAEEVGFRQAVRERDDPFGDYGSRKR